MTPSEWYQEKRQEYTERYGRNWKHLSLFEPNQNSALCELAMRSGAWCRWLQANGPDEIEMVANALMIRDYLKSRKNYPKSTQ